jgi:hypothetical protein
MTAKGIKPEAYQKAFDQHGSYRGAARALGVDHKTVREAMQRADQRKAELERAGYNLSNHQRSGQQAWDIHVAAFERKVGKSIAATDQIINRSGPFVIFHATDEHIDDDASALNVLADDITISHGMDAIMAHGGDLLNNWPMAGKLAKQWAEQSCTLPDALLRAQHFIEIFKPDVWVDGNHEEMNPYLMSMFDGWLPKKTLRDYWRCNFTVCVKAGRDTRVALSHKFQKGQSWFHGMHGHIREMLQTEERDLYLDGHFHQSAVMYHSLPERGHSALLVASSGYKVVDKWATRISRGGKLPYLPGRAHWVVVDPFADIGQQSAHAFECPRMAEVFLNGLQNLRHL